MTSQNKTILIVDDEPQIVSILSDIIEDMNDGRIQIETVPAVDGKEALAQLNNQQFDLVFIDLHMPNVNGSEVITKMRSSEGNNKDVPFVMVSGYLPHLEVSTVQDQFSDVYFVEKPFDPQKIQRLAKLWLFSKKAA